jgi:hypothetical protein
MTSSSLTTSHQPPDRAPVHAWARPDTPTQPLRTPGPTRQQLADSRCACRQPAVMSRPPAGATIVG